MLRQALSNLSPVPMVVGPCSNQVMLEHCSDPHCRDLLQEPFSPAPAGTVDTCSCVLRCRALLLPSDHPCRALLQGPLSPAPADTVKTCSCVLVVEPCSRQAIVEHCSNHPCRALLQVPLSPAPVGTVATCSFAFSCRSLLQLSDHRAPLQLSLSSIAPGAPAGTVERCSNVLGCRAWLQPNVHRALPRSSLSSLAPVPLVVEPCSNKTIVELCSDHPG